MLQCPHSQDQQKSESKGEENPVDDGCAFLDICGGGGVIIHLAASIGAQIGSRVSTQDIDCGNGLLLIAGSEDIGPVDLHPVFRYVCILHV